MKRLMAEPPPWTKLWAHAAVEPASLALTAVHNPDWVEDSQMGRQVVDFHAAVRVLIDTPEAQMVGEGASLEPVVDVDEYALVTVFTAEGVCIRLDGIEDLPDLFDRRDDELGTYSGLFDDDGCFTDRLKKLVCLAPMTRDVRLCVIDEVTIAPAWRGLGLGSLFTHWTMDAVEPNFGRQLYAVRSRSRTNDATATEQEAVDRFWEKMRFKRLGLDVYVRLG